MKKLFLTLLVVAAGLGTSFAQRQTSGTIRVAFTDPTNVWVQSHFYLYVYDTTTNMNDTWPGEDISNNVVTINGATYYYRDFPISSYGVGFKVIAVNVNGSGNDQSQSEDLTWCYDRTTITGDTYYSLKDEWDNSGHRKAQLKEMLYIADYENSGKVLLAEQSGENFTANFSSSDFLKFVVANSYAFSDDGTLNFSQNNGYPANIYRPNYQKSLSFQNVSANVSDDKRSEFYRWHDEGYFDASSLNNVNLEMKFVISNFNASSYSISPFIEKTIGAYDYSSFSSDYAFATPEGVTAYYASDASSKRVTLSPITNGVPAGQGVILNGTAGETVKLTPAATTDELSGNKLVAVKSGVAIPASTESQFNYVFAYQNNDLGFFKLTSSVNATADMAYLQTTEDISNAKVVFGFDDETTAIENVETQKADNAIYNLNGVRVKNPTKGIFIQNGKKVIIK